ncbi:transcription factor E [Methanothermobacter tenebrarum]|uniref:Transcription factor E n=1 Tax=Methanothermobacter tenebrarum TaxID=680118 RepID=A0A328P9E5_9EURY|nr:transcription factor E [Methanothermobacter tenebrarum]MBC7100851.1 transcription factor E [Methanobacteriales archaeon]MBC7117859.1 transcription factor E [Methanobacteriaceae archaeon]NPV63992.1 transcription factor E [Methanobacteriaceae archaeon]RAO79167.1 transcription factor E [Methanothermobacter tenebrarum]
MINNTLIQELIHEIVNEEEGVPVVECLMRGSITDEEIAEKTSLKLNTVRRILYKLYDAGIASYKRSKDPETQWYTYTWKFESEKLEKIMKKRNREIVENLKELLAFEENNMFFACKNGHYRYTFDEAAENNFRCPECHEKLEYMDNSEIIQEIKEELRLYENNGSEVPFNFRSYS